jgi:hypothetical protein
MNPIRQLRWIALPFLGLVLGLGIIWWAQVSARMTSARVLTRVLRGGQGEIMHKDKLAAVDATVSAALHAWVGRELIVDEATLPRIGRWPMVRWMKIAGAGEVTFSPADAVPTAINVAEPGDYLLRLVLTDGVETVTHDLAAQVEPAPLDLWKARHFASPSAGLAGDYADADGDGVSNIMEYALMLNPLRSDVSGLPDPSVRDGALHLSYRRPASAVDLRYEPQWSADLLTWHSDGMSQQLVASVGDIQVLRASPRSAAALQSARFLRLQVTGP